MDADAPPADTALPLLADIAEIRFPHALYSALVHHGRRKLAGDWRRGEEQAPKAYGLLGGRIGGHIGGHMGGRIDNRRVVVTHVIPLRANLRDRPDLKVDVDRLMDEVAIPSETPNARRGWVADPLEVLAAERCCEAAGSTLFGAYHMHRVAWPSDPLRDSCTAIDRCLAQDSGLWALILSLVEPDRPRLRAFFEADNAAEAAICIDGGARPC